MSGIEDYEEMLDEVLPDGWEHDGDAVLICPHGYSIELDGKCPDGCESPLRTMGLI